MRLYSFYSDEFADMCYNVMAPSALRAGFNVEAHGIGNLVTDCDNKNGNWRKLILLKLDVVLGAISRGDPFVFADADIRFYGLAAEDMLACLGDSDVSFQCDLWRRGVRCLGFFAANPTARTKAFFEEVRSRIREDWNDQEATNELLDNGYALQWDLLPNRYWTHGAHDPRRYEPGMPLNPPSDMMAHHANWVVGAKNKRRLLDEVYNMAMCLS